MAPPLPTLIDFPPYQLDLRAWQLRRDGKPVAIRPKTFAILQYLAERPGELVTKQELLDAVWPNLAVTEDVVRISAGELRAAFGDDRAAPRFIETVPRKGYRFVATMGPAPAAPHSSLSPPPTDAPTEPLVVGREHERAQIAAWMRAAAGGQRQIVFVTGDVGIGKSTLVDAALRDDAQRKAPTPFRVARGQCVEQYGAGEPYKPVLEALSALCRGADGPAITATLEGHSPRWLLDTLGAAPPSAQGSDPVPDAATYAYTLHLLATALDVLARDVPLVLVFEDVHWSDYSTLDLLSVLAQSREPARLVVLCTLRAADAIAHGHPIVTVKRELLRKGHCRELVLGGFSPADVRRYLAARFPAAAFPPDLLSLLVERSDGNPFFVATLVDHLLESGNLVDEGDRLELRSRGGDVRTSIPAGLRAAIEPRLERLSADELRVLEAASVAGAEFSAHAVAAVTPATNPLGDIEEVEAVCDGLVRQQELLRSRGESTWPDGSSSARYAFRHVLYKQVLEQRIPVSARRRLHQTVGERLEAGYGARTPEVANELAAHFQRSGDLPRAVRYHGEAAAHARSRFSHQETRAHVEAALALLRGESETTDVMERRLPLLDHLGWASFAARGWGNEDSARAFAEMRAIAERLDGAEARFKAMEGELVVHTMRAEYASARQRGDEMLALAEQIGNRTAVLSALPPIGAVLIHLGELDAAEAIAERGRALADVDASSMHLISSELLLLSSYALRGQIAAARALGRQIVELASRSDVPYLRAHAAVYAASVCQMMRDVPGARALAADAERITTDLGFAGIGALATLYRAWCDVQEGTSGAAVDELRSAYDAYVASGQRISASSYGVVVADGQLAAGNVELASEMLDLVSAFIAETGEQIAAHELHRLRGECLVARGNGRSRTTKARDCFEQAIAMAAGQGALLFELRATTSLCRLQPRAGTKRLRRLVERFGADDDCADLRAAHAMLSA
jgi:predicted ATPase/DNA-binding winged helix-turn-helix (wHTH) protein